MAERPETALRFAEAALKLAPATGEAATLELLRGEALVDLKREPEAMAAIAAAVVDDPGVPRGWLLKATLARRLGDFSAAEVAILEAARRTPTDTDAAGEVQLEAGMIALAQGKRDLAQAAWAAAASGDAEWQSTVAAEAALAQLAAEAAPEAAAEPAAEAAAEPAAELAPR
jgi:tetratricopeptide (TPR) repeat protein